MAVGIFAFAGVALIGHFSIGLKTNRDSVEELEATHLAESFFSTRRAAPVADLSANGFPLSSFTNSIAATLPLYVNEGGISTNQANARFGLLYSVTPNMNAKVSRVYLCLFWPPQVTPAKAQGRYETVSTFTLP